MNKNVSQISIHNIPLDAWATIMIYIDSENIVNTFEVLFESNALRVPKEYRLDAFWVLVALVRLELQKLESPINPYPNGKEYLKSYDQLKLMGVPADIAREAIEESEGNLFYAFEYLGWA